MTWISVTLADAGRCLVRVKPDPEAVLGMGAPFLPEYPPVRIVALLDVDDAQAMTRRVIQMRPGWDDGLSEGMRALVDALARGHP